MYFVLTRLFMQTVARSCLYKAWSPLGSSHVTKAHYLSASLYLSAGNRAGLGQTAAAHGPAQPLPDLQLWARLQAERQSLFELFLCVCMCMYLFFDIFNQELSLHRAVEM